jgi:guanylate kinase
MTSATVDTALRDEGRYDYIIVNTDLDSSIAQVRNILSAERLKRARQVGLGDFVQGMRGS